MFNTPRDRRYIPFLKDLHRSVLFDWYMEVGCRTGRGFAEVRGKTIAVDPFFRIESNVIGQKPALHVLQQTSDEFFASGFVEAIGAELGFSFLDGMHLMENLLRDILHTEAVSHPGGVIALHDCCPFNFEMTTRDVANAPTDAWTGDVWKLIPILQKYRSDLTIHVLGCRPTGLVLLSNLDPENTALADQYETILSEWQGVTLRDYGAAQFYDSFDYTPCAEVEGSGYQLFERVRMSENAALTPEYISP